MGKSTLTPHEARTAAVFLKRVVARGHDEAQALVEVVAKLEQIADTTYNARQRTTV